MNHKFESTDTVPDQFAAKHSDFLSDVMDGLSRPQKRLPSKYFYDQRGSELFDQICDLEEYYPTRTEIEIMRAHSEEMASTLSERSTLVEFGSGSSVKTTFLLDQLPNLGLYIPVDISAEHLAITGDALRQEYAHIPVKPLATDFTILDSLPRGFESAPFPRNVYFPGSTIGNFKPSKAAELLANISRIIGDDGMLLLGVDLVKDPAILKAAYNDSLGVTAAFNKNVLFRINEELGGDFDLSRFEHRAIWNPTDSRIEMHLESLTEQSVRLSNQTIKFANGETICTEYSHKYDSDSIERLAAISGLQTFGRWTDDQEWFSVVGLRNIRRD